MDWFFRNKKPSPCKPGMPADDGSIGLSSLARTNLVLAVRYLPKNSKPRVKPEREPSGILIWQGLEGTHSSCFDGECRSLQWEDEFYPLFRVSHKFSPRSTATTCKNLFLRVFIASNFQSPIQTPVVVLPKSKSTKIQP